jgi:hypothetical protein
VLFGQCSSGPGKIIFFEAGYDGGVAEWFVADDFRSLHTKYTIREYTDEKLIVESPQWDICIHM